MSWSKWSQQICRKTAWRHLWMALSIKIIKWIFYPFYFLWENTIWPSFMIKKQSANSEKKRVSEWNPSIWINVHTIRRGTVRVHSSTQKLSVPWSVCISYSIATPKFFKESSNFSSTRRGTPSLKKCVKVEKSVTTIFFQLSDIEKIPNS